MGMKEVLQSIKKAEDDAAEALKSASEESAKILSDARTKASKIVQTAADDSLTNSAKALEDARITAGTEAKTVHSEGEAKVKEIMDNAASKREKAVQLVIDSLMP